MDDERQSLVDRAVERLSPAAAAEPLSPPPVDWRFVTALAGLIALGPALTIGGAMVVHRTVRADTARLQAQMEARLASEQTDRAARDLLRGAVREAPVAIWLERLATALPAEARVARMERMADGRIELDILTPDPDLLRGALRRQPSLAGFREAGQRRAEGMILVTVRRPA